MNTATFTINQFTDGRGHRFTASWNGIVRIDSGWHTDASDAWAALTAGLAPRLARRALTAA